jgi:pentapeptide repeat protein
VIIHRERQPPEPWPIYTSRPKSRWLKPFYGLNWLCAWTAHLLSRWVLLEILEYLGTFSILIGVVFYFAESGDRVKQKHYQAWQVINTAQGGGGSGGRIEALQELNADRVPLVGIDLSDAFLQGLRLDHADLTRSNFGSADLRDSSFISARLEYAAFNSANLRGSALGKANLRHTSFTDADLAGADLSGADLSESRLDKADLRDANLAGIRWPGITSLKFANIFRAKSLPAGFAQWALHHGAVSLESDEEWNSLQASGPRKAKSSEDGQ